MFCRLYTSAKNTDCLMVRQDGSLGTVRQHGSPEAHLNLAMWPEKIRSLGPYAAVQAKPDYEKTSPSWGGQMQCQEQSEKV